MSQQASTQQSAKGQQAQAKIEQALGQLDTARKQYEDAVNKASAAAPQIKAELQKSGAVLKEAVDKARGEIKQAISDVIGTAQGEAQRLKGAGQQAAGGGGSAETEEE